MHAQHHAEETETQVLDIGLEQLRNYVSLCELELIPSAAQSISTGCSFSIPLFASALANTKASDVREEKQDANNFTQRNTNPNQALPALSPKSESLGKLWREPGVDLNEVSPTEEERETYQVEKDGLAHSTTGPNCSVCDEPLTYEVLVNGSTCDMCGFI